jgi:hypothetical protein
MKNVPYECLAKMKDIDYTSGGAGRCIEGVVSIHAFFTVLKTSYIWYLLALC